MDNRFAHALPFSFIHFKSACFLLSQCDGVAVDVVIVVVNVVVVVVVVVIVSILLLECCSRLEFNVAVPKLLL